MRRFLLILLFAGGWALAQESQDAKSLAELAKKNRESQSQPSSGKQVRVITNKDLTKLDSNVSRSSSSRSALRAAPAAAGQEAEEKPKPGAKEEEIEDLQREFDQARRDLEMAVSEGLVLQLRMNNLRNAWLNRSDGPTQERVLALMAETNESIEKNKQAQQEAREEVRQLQRKASSLGLTNKEITNMTGKLPENSAQVGAPEIQQE